MQVIRKAVLAGVLGGFAALVLAAVPAQARDLKVTVTTPVAPAPTVVVAPQPVQVYSPPVQVYTLPPQVVVTPPPVVIREAPVVVRESPVVIREYQVPAPRATYYGPPGVVIYHTD
jgi:hypothetical protein